MTNTSKRLFHLFLLGLLTTQLFGKADRFRVVWQNDPATSAIIAWDQVSGSNPTLHLDINDYGNSVDDYAVVKKPDRTNSAKGMNNTFVRLSGLLPSTSYFFIVKDSEGQSRQYFFTTAPNNPYERLSIIAGGDSRNHRDARQDANKLVGKLRPHCVMFGGDYTAGDSSVEWVNWLDDWQLTIAKDGRITPIIPARGNHEESNKTLVQIFDVQTPQVFYAISLGGDLLRIYTLNTMIPVGGAQKEWLESDLRANSHHTWKTAHYHHPMRPHTSRKSEKHDQVVHWAPLFFRYNLNLAVECDAHVVKSTFPIRPSKGGNSEQGFVRDDVAGTVYVGEGCWGAPLRANNDDKSWTRASGSFNQFHWIFVDQEKIEVRFVKTDGADRVSDIDPTNIFKAPVGLNIWSPRSGDVIEIAKRDADVPGMGEEILASRSGYEKSSSKASVMSSKSKVEDEMGDWESCPMLMCDASSEIVKMKYDLEEQCDVVIRIVNREKQEVSRIELVNQTPNTYLKDLQTGHLAAGRYLAIVKANGRVVKRYRIMKK